MTALVSLYGLFANASAVNDQLSSLSGILPSSALDILHEQIARLTSKGDTKLGFGFVIGLGAALWSANAGMKAIIDALNVVYREGKARIYQAQSCLACIHSRRHSLSAARIGRCRGFTPRSEPARPICDHRHFFPCCAWPLLLALVIIGLALIYRWAPSRREPRWQWLTVGSIFAAAAWLGSSALLSWYLSNFAHYDAAYGSLGAGIGLMMWMWGPPSSFSSERSSIPRSSIKQLRILPLSGTGLSEPGGR